MNDLRRTTAAQLEAMGFSHRDARTLILSDNLPTPLTADILKNFELLFRYIDPSKLKPEEVMMAAYFVRRPVEQVRFMAEIQAEEPEQIKAFCWSGYRFDEDRSSETEYVFVRSIIPGKGRRSVQI